MQKPSEDTKEICNCKSLLLFQISDNEYFRNLLKHPRLWDDQFPEVHISPELQVY